MSPGGRFCLRPIGDGGVCAPARGTLSFKKGWKERPGANKNIFNVLLFSPGPRGRRERAAYGLMTFMSWPLRRPSFCCCFRCAAAPWWHATIGAVICQQSRLRGANNAATYCLLLHWHGTRGGDHCLPATQKSVLWDNCFYILKSEGKKKH